MGEDEVMQSLSLQGEEKGKALKKCHEVLASWGLKMPDVTPDPWHFGLNDFYKIGLTVFEVNNNVKEGYCGLFMFMFAGQTCPMHHHRVKHETFFIVKGRVEMELDGKKFIMEQGDTLVVNQNAKHIFTALDDSLILECSKPDIVDDSIFDDKRISEIISGT